AFCQEALIWRQLCHKNILPFYGVSEDIFASGLCLISPWMENGNIHDFLHTHPMHDRRGWVWDVAAGIQYLHNLDPCIIHKDIRGANILVGPDCQCLLTDFGISLISETQMPGSTTRGRGSIRWLPPEMITASEFDDSLFQQVDIYSFGCTIIEMYTGKLPYAELTDGAAITRIMQNRAPSQP
ncbi:kinase-like protein, partial [Hymenopellis radicata]